MTREGERLVVVQMNCHDCLHLDLQNWASSLGE